MKKSLVALVLALCLLMTVLAVPAVAEEKPAGWNNVNAEGYVYPDYTGEKIRFMWWAAMPAPRSRPKSWKCTSS